MTKPTLVLAATGIGWFAAFSIVPSLDSSGRSGVSPDCGDSPTMVTQQAQAAKGRTDGRHQARSPVLSGARARVAPTTPSRSSNEHPSWSPSGEWIAFDSDMSGHRQIWLVRPDGRGLRRLSASPSVQVAPSWHPTGDSIAFLRQVGEAYLPFIAPLDGGEARPIDRGNGISAVRWSPSGGEILFVRDTPQGRVITIARFDGTGARDLVVGGRYNGFPVWSPDGTHIVFTSDRRGARDLYYQELASDAVRALSRSVGDDIAFAFSPDGREVLFHSDRDKKGVFQTYIVNLDSGAERQLTRGEDFNGVPSMSPDGRHVVLETSRWGGRDLMIVDRADGSVRRLLPP